MFQTKEFRKVNALKVDNAAKIIEKNRVLLNFFSYQPLFM